MDSQIAIVGGGPCGMLTALLLARHGVSCVVFERHPDISTHPKAMGIKRRTAEIYRSLGLLDQMMTASFISPETQMMVWAKSLSGEEIGRAPIADQSSPFSPCVPFHCPQTHTEKVLLEALREEARLEVLFGHEVRSLTQTDDGVMLEGRVGSGEAFSCSAQWVVAADGAGSGIRHELGIDAVGPGDMGHFLNVFVRSDLSEIIRGRESLLYTILREDFAEFLVSVNGRDLWLMHQFLQPGETRGDYSETLLAEIFRSAAGVEVDHAVDILGVAPWVMSPKVAAQFRDGRVLLTGDASSRLSPAGGLGMNTGMQSAHNLAWKLAYVVTGKADATLLDSYHVERHALALAVMEHANANASNVFHEVELGLKGDFDALREAIHTSNRQGAEHGFDIGIAYPAGALVADGSPPPDLADPINDYSPDARPGARMPHFLIRSDDREVSSLDLVGNQFLLLAGADAVLSEGGDLPETVRLFRIGEPEAMRILGIDGTGAVLVRPDGYVGWRVKADASKSSMLTGLDTILG